MPKRYVIEWDPVPVPASSSGESTARFRLHDEPDPPDDCPRRPKKAKVKNGKRKAAPPDKNPWTCEEIHSVLGVTLEEKA